MVFGRRIGLDLSPVEQPRFPGWFQSSTSEFSGCIRQTLHTQSPTCLPQSVVVPLEWDRRVGTSQILSKVRNFQRKSPAPGQKSWSLSGGFQWGADGGCWELGRHVSLMCFRQNSNPMEISFYFFPNSDRYKIVCMAFVEVWRPVTELQKWELAIEFEWRTKMVSEIDL